MAMRFERSEKPLTNAQLETKFRDRARNPARQRSLF
jgi:hypothetical protein